MSLGLIAKKNKEVNKVILLPVGQIVSNPSQPRKFFDPDAIQELAGSIVSNGLLQPISVRKKSDNVYELIAGERRLMAFRALAREYIPAIVEQFSDEQSAVLSLIENLQRKNLNYFEEAMGIFRLMREQNLTQQQVSQRLGKAQSTVANKLRLLKYPIELQEKMLGAFLTERHARAVLKVPELPLQEQVIDYVIEKRLNVEQTERYIDRLLKAPGAAKRPRLFVVKDMRIFINSINKAVEMMNNAGISVEANRQETEEYLEYILKIPKAEAYQSTHQKR